MANPFLELDELDLQPAQFGEVGLVPEQPLFHNVGGDGRFGVGRHWAGHTDGMARAGRGAVQATPSALDPGLGAVLRRPLPRNLASRGICLLGHESAPERSLQRFEP